MTDVTCAFDDDGADYDSHEFNQRDTFPKLPGYDVTCEDVFGIPLISGFSLALDEERSANLTEGQIFGTPGFMAPEQAAGRIRDLGPATDVYGLGAILYTMLAGRSPYGKKDTNVCTIISRILEHDPEPVSSMNATVDSRLEAICHKCLARKPESRYASALHLSHDLRNYLEHTGGRR